MTRKVHQEQPPISSPLQRQKERVSTQASHSSSSHSEPQTHHLSYQPLGRFHQRRLLRSHKGITSRVIRESPLRENLPGSSNDSMHHKLKVPPALTAIGVKRLPCRTERGREEDSRSCYERSRTKASVSRQALERHSAVHRWSSLRPRLRGSLRVSSLDPHCVKRASETPRTTCRYRMRGCSKLIPVPSPLRHKPRPHKDKFYLRWQIIRYKALRFHSSPYLLARSLPQ